MSDECDDVVMRPRGPGWLVRRVARADRAETLRALAAADQRKPAPAPLSRPDRFGVSLPRLRFLERGLDHDA